MIKVLLHPCYFGSISFWLTILNADKMVFEVCDNYQKQTQRNRSNILAANGRLTLTVPVNFTQKNRQLYKNVKIASTNWQSQHLKSLDSAYKMSPFYEYFIDDIIELLHKDYATLMELNIASLKLVGELLGIPFHFQKTKMYNSNPSFLKDCRYLIQKNPVLPYQLKEYTQVFSTKYGFTPNLCILDLLFNEGPNAENYLRKHQLR